MFLLANEPEEERVVWLEQDTGVIYRHYTWNKWEELR